MKRWEVLYLDYGPELSETPLDPPARHWTLIGALLHLYRIQPTQPGLDWTYRVRRVKKPDGALRR